MAPRSISACAEAGPNEPPLRSRTRRTFMSTGSTGAIEREPCDGVGGVPPTPGSSVRSSGRPRRRFGGPLGEVERRGGCTPAPATRGLRPQASRRRAPRPKASARATGTSGRPARPGSAEHDLRDEDRIRVARLPPGQVSFVLVEPARSASSTAPTLQGQPDPRVRATVRADPRAGGAVVRPGDRLHRCEPEPAPVCRTGRPR